MPMTRNGFGVDAPPPSPPSQPPMPGYAPCPPPNQPAFGHSLRWPALLGAAAVGALVAAAAAAVITVQVRDAPGPAQESAAPLTVTVDPPTPDSPTPLPTAQADRKTCEQGWIPAGEFIDGAKAELARTPAGMSVTDPAIRANPEWTAAVDRAGDLYRQAGDALASNITPGATPVLTEAAHTAAESARLLGDAISTRDPINGNAGEIANEAAAQMGALCQRLAPR